MRQSIIGLTGYGPTLFGAHTSADIQMDFFGGVPTTYGGSNSGIAELRVARFRMDWSKTSVVAGLDYPFFAPNLPTSYMTVVVPGFASAGKLWSWTPTIRAEHRFDGAFSAFKVEAGFLAPKSYSYYAPNTNVLISSPSENSRQPTYATRISASTHSEDRPATIGFGGGLFAAAVRGRIRSAGLGGNDGLEVSAAAAYRTQRRIFYRARHRWVRRSAAESASAGERILLRVGQRAGVGEHRRHRRMDAIQVSREFAQRIQRRGWVGWAELQRIFAALGRAIRFCSRCPREIRCCLPTIFSSRDRTCFSRSSIGGCGPLTSTGRRIRRINLDWQWDFSFSL